MKQLSEIRLAIEWWKLWKSIPVFSWIRAAEFYRKGDYQKAADLYADGISKNQKSKALHYATLDYSYCLYQLGRYEESVEALERVIKAGVQIEEAYTLLVKQYSILGSSSLSYEVLLQASEVFPKNAQILSGLLEASVKSESDIKKILKIKDELEQLREKIELNDERLMIIDSSIAYFEFVHGDLQLADQMISRLLATTQAPYQVYLMRAERFMDKGRVFHAREQFRKASRLRPADPRASMMLARTYMAAGDFCEPQSAADIALEVCKKTNWKNPEAVWLLAECHELLDDEEQAEIFFAYANRLQAIKGLEQAVSIRAIDQVERLQQIVH